MENASLSLPICKGILCTQIAPFCGGVPEARCNTIKKKNGSLFRDNLQFCKAPVYSHELRSKVCNCETSWNVASLLWMTYGWLTADLPVHRLQGGVQVILHMEERRPGRGFLDGIWQSDDPAVIAEPFGSLKGRTERKKKVPKGHTGGRWRR